MESLDSTYFNSYANFEIHKAMLKDSVRTESYRRAILDNCDQFAGKVVLDIGCGTGILSMFAAQAGAAHVYAVDQSDIIETATKIITENGLENKITCIKGKIENIDLPVHKVDIIISEWMGYMLLFEAMLASIVYARDNYLIEGGLILPSHCTLQLCAIDEDDHIAEQTEWTESFHDYRFNRLRSLFFKRPGIRNCNKNRLLSAPDRLLEIDIYQINKADVSNHCCDFHLTTLPTLEGISIHALMVYFEVRFAGGLESPTYFSTGPISDITHWQQTIFYLENEILVKPGESVSGTFDISPKQNNARHLDISIELIKNQKDNNPPLDLGSQSYSMF